MLDPSRPRLPLRYRIVRSCADGSARLFSPLIFPLVDRALCKKIHIADGLDGIEVTAPNCDDDMRVILYLHGGAHFFCSVWTHRELLGRLSAATQAHVVAINYRLAPENPFPAGLEDTLAAFQWLRAERPNASIAVAGDSAGGNLAFALLVRLAQLHMPQPIACISISPWLLLETSHLPEHLRLFSELYRQGKPASDPLVSPALANVDIAKQFPPILIHAAEKEMVTADAKAMASLCRQAGIPLEFELFGGTVHAFQAIPWIFPEASRVSLTRIGNFLENHWRTKPLSRL